MATSGQASKLTVTMMQEVDADGYGEVPMLSWLLSDPSYDFQLFQYDMAGDGVVTSEIYSIQTDEAGLQALQLDFPGVRFYRQVDIDDDMPIRR